MRLTRPVVTAKETTIPLETVKRSGFLDGEIKSFKNEQLLALAHAKGSNINDAKAVFDILPDMRYATELIVSETLSPNDLSPPTMNIVLDTSKYDIELEDSKVADTLNAYFKEGGVIDIESNLYRYLEESLVTAGAVPIMCLKTSEIDTIINMVTKKSPDDHNFNLSMESAKKTIYNNTRVIVKENKVLEAIGITVTDNLNAIREPLLNASLYERTLQGYGYENAHGTSVALTEGIRYADPDGNEPIFIKLPAESVIPVFLKGQPEKHLGYYIPLVDGYPVSHQEDSSEMERLAKRMKEILKGTNDNYGALKSFTSTDGFLDTEEITADDYMNAFASKVREELKNTINKTLVRRDISVANNEDTWMLLFRHAMAKSEVKMLYVPAGVINYIAFDYDSRGMGLSLLEKTKLFSTVRAALLLADVFGGIKNSIPMTKVAVTIDEEDADPYYTLEVIKDRISKMTGATLPIGLLRISDLSTALQKASVHLEVDGGTAFPNTKATIEDGSRQIVKADMDLTNNLKKLHLSGFGTSPEKVDRALEGDYAISTVTTNLLDARRVALRQKTYEKHITDLIRNIIRLSPKLKKLIEEFDAGDLTFEQKLSMVKFRLPDSNVSKIKMLTEEFTDDIALIEAAVDAEYSPDLLQDMLTGQNLPGPAKGLREAILAEYKKQWFRERGVMSHIVDLTDEQKADMVKSIISQTRSKLKSISKLAEAVVKEEQSADKKLQELQMGDDPNAGGDAFGTPPAEGELPAEGEPPAEGGEGGEEDIFAEPPQE